MSLYIAKSDGTRELFDAHKLVSSLMHSGAERAIAEAIAEEVTKTLYNGISTHEIYAQAFSRLRTHKRSAASRYSLKRALLQFGPSGFPFEAYLAKLFEAEGYKTAIDQIINGKYVEHEVDVVLTKGNEVTYVEAKFHNDAGYKCDLKTALYVQARTEDIGAKGMLVTNTKFTSKALQYGEGVGLELLSWDYPQGRSLHDRIHAAKLYPITALTTLSRREKVALLSERLVLCADIPTNGDALARAGVNGKKAAAVLEEAVALCVPGNDI